MPSTTKQRSINSTQIKDLARIIANKTETEEQRKCPYCHKYSKHIYHNNPELNNLPHGQVLPGFDFVDRKFTKRPDLDINIVWVNSQAYIVYDTEMDAGLIKIVFCPICGRKLEKTWD